MDYDLEDSEPVFEKNLDEPIAGVSEQFRSSMLDCKHSLYMAIVFSLDVDTDDAHRAELIQDYLFALQHLEHQLTAITNNISPRLQDFPETAQSNINTLFELFNSICRENEGVPVNMIPYKDYIHSSLHIFPYIQSDKFIE
jgi:hypothetical protein